MEELNLGKCCSCEKEGPDVCNIMSLGYKAPEPNKGWGCFQCGLSMNGAIAVCCDDCTEDGVRLLRFVVVGYPAENRRMPFADFISTAEKFEHDMSKHPEVQGD